MTKVLVLCALLSCSVSPSEPSEPWHPYITEPPELHDPAFDDKGCLTVEQREQLAVELADAREYQLRAAHALDTCRAMLDE